MVLWKCHLLPCFAPPPQISFNASTPLNVVDRLYLNYNIDTGSLFNGIDFFDPKFRALSKSLGPAILRVGGTAVDYSFYQPDVPYIVGQVNGASWQAVLRVEVREAPDTATAVAAPPPHVRRGAGNAAGNTVGGAAMLDALAGYAEATGFTLLYDFNGLRCVVLVRYGEACAASATCLTVLSTVAAAATAPRHHAVAPRRNRTRSCSFRGSSGVGPWDPTGNATAILDHFAATWTGRVNFSWAMGNEPDLWKVRSPPRKHARMHAQLAG